MRNQTNHSGANHFTVSGISQPLEDRALKMAMQFFGEELLPLLGVTTSIKRIAPTEQVHLEIKDFLEDFNFEMEDGTWRHYEFESDELTISDLRRFRSYEAITSSYYGVEVITSVICTANTNIRLRELSQGINIYRVEIIQLKDRSVDEMIQALETRQSTGSVERQDLIPLLLTPLMSGTMSADERIRRSISLLHQERTLLGKQDLLRMEAVLYTLAVKFLSEIELEKLEEVFHMTYLGELLERRGIEQGIEQGLKRGLEQGMEKGL